MKINLNVSQKEFKAIFNSAHNYLCDLYDLNSQNKLPKEWKLQMVDLKTGLNKMLNKIKEGN